MDEDIASLLNAEGFRTTKRGLFSSKTIWLLCQRTGLPAVKPNGPHPDQWEVEDPDQGWHLFRGRSDTHGRCLPRNDLLVAADRTYLGKAAAKRNPLEDLTHASGNWRAAGLRSKSQATNEGGIMKSSLIQR